MIHSQKLQHLPCVYRILCETKISLQHVSWSKARANSAVPLHDEMLTDNFVETGCYHQKILSLSNYFFQYALTNKCSC